MRLYKDIVLKDYELLRQNELVGHMNPDYWKGDIVSTLKYILSLPESVVSIKKSYYASKIKLNFFAKYDILYLDISKAFELDWDIKKVLVDFELFALFVSTFCRVQDGHFYDDFPAIPIESEVFVSFRFAKNGCLMHRTSSEWLFQYYGMRADPELVRYFDETVVADYFKRICSETEEFLQTL